MKDRQDNREMKMTDGEMPGELSALLSELEADHGVQLSLGGSSARQRYGREVRQGNNVKIAERDLQRKVVSAPAVMYRDVADVRTILSLTWSMMILALLLVASGVGNVYQCWRRPDRIVVDGGTGRVLSINDRNYGKEEGVEFGPDRLTREDKIYITREFVKAVYQ